MSKPIRVLVFGTTGTGKTSICNELTGEKQKTSDSAMGVTFESYTYNPVDLDSDKSLILTDTTGLNESTRGTVKAQDAAKQLLSLLKKSPEGYNLLIQTFRLPRITQNLESNYQFFVETITESKIPVILVAIGCENIKPMSKWKDMNEMSFQTIGLKYKDIICTCFIQEGPLASFCEELRNESREAILKAIAYYAAPESIRLYKKGSFFGFFKKVWNWVARWLGLEDLTVALNESVVQLLMRIGFTRKDAITIVNNEDF